MTDPRGVHDERRRDRRASSAAPSASPPATSPAARSRHRRRRALPPGELLQDPPHGRGHAAGRRGRAAARRPAHADRGGQEPRQHAHPLPRGPAPERARPPLSDDHPQRQHRHRHALAPRRPGLRQRDHARARPASRSTASCPTASTSSSSRAPATSGRGSAARRSSPDGGSSRRAGSATTRSARVLEENARLSGAGFLHLYERRWGRDESLGYEDSFVVDQALDNRARPATWPSSWR